MKSIDSYEDEKIYVIITRNTCKERNDTRRSESYNYKEGSGEILSLLLEMNTRSIDSQPLTVPKINVSVTAADPSTRFSPRLCETGGGLMGLLGNTQVGRHPSYETIICMYSQKLIKKIWLCNCLHFGLCYKPK